MINIVITVFIFLLLVTQKILLLNEESLILLCFISFTILGLRNLSGTISSSLEEQSFQIRASLTHSLEKLLLGLKQFSILYKNYEVTLKKFNELKIYYLRLVTLLADLLPSFNKHYLSFIYSQKLVFLNKIEKQTIKLFLIIILKKLNLVVRNKYFYSSSVQFNQFICLNSILLRECIQFIKPKKI